MVLGGGTVKIAANFEVSFHRFLNAAGEPVAELPAFARDPALLISLYRAMVFTRTFDSKAIALQRTGKLGTFASIAGQEAVGIGVASSMRPEDVLLPSYRDYGAQLWRGVTPVEILLYWGGDERGSEFAGPRQDFPIAVPIATQICHAAGVATAFHLRGEPRVAVTLFGDGATSKGDFYEAINLAGAWQLPVVFVASNNEWAISCPRATQTGAATLAQKAIAGGFEGLQVDGNDVVAVHEAMRAALAKARGGGGPTLIEALTYRLGDHTTADDATRYRDAGEVALRWNEEPILRLRNYLVSQGAWDRAQEEALAKESSARVQEAVEKYLAMPPLGSAGMFDFLYATLPPVMRTQRDAAVDRSAAEGEHG